MQLNPTRETLGSGDQSWLGSAHGTNEGKPVTLDISAFTEGTHYPDGYLPSGLPLAELTGTGLYGPYTVAGAGALTDATAEQWDLDLDDATSAIFDVAGEEASIAAADTAAQAKTKLLALATFQDLATADITATKPTSTTFRFVFPAGREVPNPIVGAATGGSTPTVLATVTTAGTPAEAAAGGLGTLAGFLFCDVKTDGSTDPVGTILEHCNILADRLPVDTDLSDGWFSRTVTEA
jgi:hypothetical protein